MIGMAAAARAPSGHVAAARPKIMSLHSRRPCYVVDKRSLPRSALPVCNMRAPVLALAVPQPYWQTEGLG
jgi:hypothetical protein